MSAESAARFSIVAIGISAGGLEACKKLLDALPPRSGLAFLIVQHLEPSPENLLVELLGARTPMPVVQAIDGMGIERDRVHVIPPGAYLSVDGADILRLSQPPERHAARLPFDFLLNSLANNFGQRVVCVVMSGTGADGSLGLKSVKAKGGLVLAQAIGEADYDGMPRSAIATGEVDRILTAAEIASALLERSAWPPPDHDWLPDIIDLLRKKSVYDFTLYKRGTLERHVERRMAVAGLSTGQSYFEHLSRQDDEVEQLAREMFINVTGFFRDPLVFENLAREIVPRLVEDHPVDGPLRIWVAGCSSGEETYSLAMLFYEEINKSKRELKLQIFASDIDADAVASAREGLYHNAIEANVSAERLNRFFIREDRGYRITPELRACVIFSVHDVLADPPFAKLDFVSCRNLLIYLMPEAQLRVFSQFHFALRPNGLLLLGNSEAVATGDDGFAVVSKPMHLYRRVGGNRPGKFGLALRSSDESRLRAQSGLAPAASRQTSFAELCRAMVLETFGPATVLVNSKLECLFFQGPTDRYLKVASGRPSRDVVAMARGGVQARLRSAIQGAQQTRARFASSVGQIKGDAGPISFKVVVVPAFHAGEGLLFICFVESPAGVLEAPSPGDTSRVNELEREFAASTVELQTAVRNLETTSAEQVASYEEAMSVNEEYQSKNEELMASKEELQSLNEELSALNSQLQETLERQRTSANDLQNVLYSTNVATIFLDTRFNIRFFTPSTKAVFRIIPRDVGRPLSDLKSLAPDSDLMSDAQQVLETQSPIAREISGPDATWFMRRILPYRTSEKTTEGVVITFVDITERRSAAQALTEAKRQAEQASIAKSRFLAAASHDLRQPLQTLSLLHGLLGKKVAGEKEQKLVGRMDDALDAMTNMLNTLLDINQIEVGAIKVEAVAFPLNALFDQLREEMTFHAQSLGLELKVAPCALSILSDRRLLEQIVRNLLSNALKYTQRGRVLIGCRRRGVKLRIEVWDTGLGIPSSELEAIFEDYHQIENPAREHSRGLGLGLSIVKSLCELLGHRIGVRSLPGRGSVFWVEVPVASRAGTARAVKVAGSAATDGASTPTRAQTILIVEDDPQVREYLALFLTEEGYRAVTTVDGPAALALLENAEARPDLVLADYNLPNGLTGVEVARRVWETGDVKTPFVILTGDISTAALRDIALHDCVQFRKPVNLHELTRMIAKLLAKPAPLLAAVRLEVQTARERPKVFVVDDDAQVRDAVGAVLEDEGHAVATFASCEAFLDAYRPEKGACLLIDAYLPGMSGLQLLRKLKAEGRHLPAIMITGESDVAIAVEAMRAGASDFIEKPIGREELVASLTRVLELSRDSAKLAEWRDMAASHLEGLTARQIQVMDMVLAGHPSKNIAADLGISQRTVENHRIRIMKRTGARSLPALARLALIASGVEASPPSTTEEPGDTNRWRTGPTR